MVPKHFKLWNQFNMIKLTFANKQKISYHLSLNKSIR